MNKLIAEKSQNTVVNPTFIIGNIPPIKVIQADESTAVFFKFPFGFNSPITYADIDFKVAYKSMPFGITKNQEVRFVSEQDINGHLIWMQRAVSEDVLNHANQKLSNRPTTRFIVGLPRPVRCRRVHTLDCISE